MRNPRPTLPNRNTLYLARSGGGKSQALKQSPLLPRSPLARVILWDPNEDHEAESYSRMSDFLRALGRADARSKGQRQGMRISYTGPDSVKAYLIWCQAVCEVLDGRLYTHLIAEELSTVSTGSGKAPLPATKMMNQVRKYGGIFHGTSQKPQEINKTYFEQCEHRFVGCQKTLRQKKLVAEEIGVTVQDVDALQPLDFFYDNGKTTEKRTIDYVGQSVFFAGPAPGRVG